jgi:hypothetical protein
VSVEPRKGIVVKYNYQITAHLGRTTPKKGKLDAERAAQGAALTLDVSPGSAAIVPGAGRSALTHAPDHPASRVSARDQRPAAPTRRTPARRAS